MISRTQICYSSIVRLWVVTGKLLQNFKSSKVMFTWNNNVHPRASSMCIRVANVHNYTQLNKHWLSVSFHFKKKKCLCTQPTTFKWKGIYSLTKTDIRMNKREDIYCLPIYSLLDTTLKFTLLFCTLTLINKKWLSKLDGYWILCLRLWITLQISVELMSV